VFGAAETGEREQGVDRGQSGVAGSCAVASVVLEMVEEPGDQVGVEIGAGEEICGRGTRPTAAQVVRHRHHCGRIQRQQP
jgi:hypothetical protein